MSFATQFDALLLGSLTAHAQRATAADVERALQQSGVTVGQSPPPRSLADFAALLSPAAAAPVYLEAIAQEAHRLTVNQFGRVVRLFAPLYLSNECINVCRYCGFSRDNPILRVTLSPEQVWEESRYLLAQGFRHILLVAGEHPHFVSDKYLADCAQRLHADWPSISFEVGPLETAAYVPLVEAGAEGLVVYQETYDRRVYDAMHVSGPKREFDWRLETPERGYAAGFKRLGIGALLGLADWRGEAVRVAAHAQYLLRNCWQSQLTISVPRLRPAAGEFQPLAPVSDRDLVQYICALRLMFPQVGIVLSTREPAALRDRLIPLGITMVSAGSHTEPGGYTGQGRADLHLTKRGRLVKATEALIASEGEHATVQFQIADDRSPADVANRLAEMGYEPVWKDWEAVLNGR